MKKTSATMECQPFGQRDVSSSSSSSGSSKQSFYTQVPESPISVTYSTFLNNDRYNNDPSPGTTKVEIETGVYTPSQRSLSSPTSPHKWHPTTNPGLPNNRNYQPTNSQYEEREGNLFPYPHDNGEEASCLCLPPLITRAQFNVANEIKAMAGTVFETLRVGADWVPPVPPETESESESDAERGLGRGFGRRGRRRRQKWKGPPPPILFPMCVLPLYHNQPTQREFQEQERSGREGEVPLRRLGDGVGAIGEMSAEIYRRVRGEGSDDGDAGNGGGRSKKKWKGKGKAVDVGGSPRDFLGSGPGDQGKLRRGTYVPVQPDRRGTRWQPRGGNEDLSGEEGYYVLSNVRPKRGSLSHI